MDLKFFVPILPISLSSTILFLSTSGRNILRVMTLSLGQRAFLNPLIFVILLLAKFSHNNTEIYLLEGRHHDPT